MSSPSLSLLSPSPLLALPSLLSSLLYCFLYPDNSRLILCNVIMLTHLDLSYFSPSFCLLPSLHSSAFFASFIQHFRDIIICDTKLPSSFSSSSFFFLLSIPIHYRFNHYRLFPSPPLLHFPSLFPFLHAFSFSLYLFKLSLESYN